MSARPDPLDEIAARLEELEGRVLALERSQQEPAPAAAVPVPGAVPAASWPEPLPQFTSLFPVVGSGLLGIAGAYLLRAVSGAGLLPRTVVAPIAAVYAGVWLIAAARASLRHRFAGALFAAVSILILAPMTWEMTVRFNAMRAIIAVVMLALYGVLAIALGMRRGGAVVFSVAFAGSAIAAVALSMATHQMVPFTLLLLAMLVVCEWAGRKLDTRGVRLLVALATDAGVWMLLMIYRLAPADRTDYPAAGTALILFPALALFALEVAAVIRSILVRAEPLPVLDAIQAMVAFGLAALALVWLTPGSAVAVLGGACLMLAAGCYGVAYIPARRNDERRNFRILNVWAACLVLGAVFTLAHGPATSIALGMASFAAIALGRRIASRSLELQGVLFLLGAAILSGLAEWASRALTGGAPGNPTIPVVAVAACAVLAYAAAAERTGEEWGKQALHLIPALLAAFALAGLLTVALLGVARLFLVPDVFHVALLRTLALCSLSLALAYGGVRLGRTAMVRTAYAAVAFVAAKLVFEDLRHGHMEFTAGSIFAVALTLILVPRLTRRQRVGAAE